MTDVRVLHDRYVAVLNERHWEGLRAICTPDYFEDWPQSGERVVGVENFARIFEHYPGAASGPLPESSRVYTNERWAISPLFTTMRVSGDDDVFTAVSRGVYPDGSIWYIVSIVELRDGLMARATRFWAPTYPAPEWRAAWVQRLPTGDGPAGR